MVHLLAVACVLYSVWTLMVFPHPPSKASWRLSAILKSCAHLNGNILPADWCFRASGPGAKCKVILQRQEQRSPLLPTSLTDVAPTIFWICCTGYNLQNEPSKLISFLESADLSARRKMASLLNLSYFSYLRTQKFWLLQTQSFEECVCYLSENAKSLFFMFPNSPLWTYQK